MANTVGTGAARDKCPPLAQGTYISNEPSKAMIKVVLPNRCRFSTRSFLNILPSARLFSSQNVAPLIVSPSNTTKGRVFVDASWHMPNSPRKAREEFSEKRLPQARFLDLNQVAKGHELGLKHMIPDPEMFVKFCGEYLRCAKFSRFSPVTDIFHYSLERSGISRTSSVAL
jgi:hypothetical protein